MSAELAPSEKFFTSRLLSDTASFPAVELENSEQTLDVLVPGGYHSEKVRTAPAGRYVLWLMTSPGQDVIGEHGTRILENTLWIVCVVDAVDSYAPLQKTAARLDKVLIEAPPQAIVMEDGNTYLMQYCVRERPYSFIETLTDVERRRLGGYYRVYMSPPQ